MKLFVFFYANVGIPTVFFYLSEKLITTHHFSKTFFVVLQVDEIAITELIAPVRKFLGDDVGVGVYFEHGTICRNIVDLPDLKNLFYKSINLSSEKACERSEDKVFTWPHTLPKRADCR
jgi:hypothetical protein